jgi:hypothetical protein
MIDRVAYLNIPVRQGEKTRWMPLYQAVVHAHALKGAKGDVRSATLFIELVEDNNNQPGDAFLLQRINSRPSAELFDNLNEALLSDSDMAELSRLAELIDLGGDVTALNVSDFARLQAIINRGRGKDITPDA